MVRQPPGIGRGAGRPRDPVHDPRHVLRGGARSVPQPGGRGLRAARPPPGMGTRKLSGCGVRYGHRSAAGIPGLLHAGAGHLYRAAALRRRSGGRAVRVRRAPAGARDSRGRSRPATVRIAAPPCFSPAELAELRVTQDGREIAAASDFDARCQPVVTARLTSRAPLRLEVVLRPEAIASGARLVSGCGRDRVSRSAGEPGARPVAGSAAGDGRPVGCGFSATWCGC